MLRRSRRPTGIGVWRGCGRPAGCARAGVVICRVATWRSVSGRRSRWGWPGVSRCGQMAARLGRNVSTISREVARNRDGQGRYRASTAHAWAYERASRPKPAKLAVNVALR